MAGFGHSGSAATDLGALYTKREDISDLLLASLLPENNVLGNLAIGEEFADQVCGWVEDRLNQNTITDTTGGGQTTGSTTLNMSASDWSVLDVMWILVDEATLGTLGAEQVQITNAPTSGQWTMTRGYGGTTAVTHAQNAVWRVIASPLNQNSDLGGDKSRARVAKFNYVTTMDLNVNIAQEQIVRANAGYAPGVKDEVRYQFNQRLGELKRRMNNTLVQSRPASAQTRSSPVGDYETIAGIIPFIDGTYNSTSLPQNQNGASLTDTMINNLNALLDRQGALPDWLFGGVNVIRATARIYSDRVRIEQSDETRGFKVKYFDTDLQNSLRFLKDNAIYDTSPNAWLLLLDSARIRLRFFKGSAFYLITAPSFRDGDACRALTKFSLEFRNTGTDIGYASLFAYGIAA